MDDKSLDAIERALCDISPYPWKHTQTSSGEWWITAPDDSDHDFRNDYEPIFESSGTGEQFRLDAQFIALAPEIIEMLLRDLRAIRTIRERSCDAQAGL